MAEHRGGSGNFAEDREKASEAGRKGGQHSGGNFKNDPERASEAGKKGGKNSHGGGRKSGDSYRLMSCDADKSSLRQNLWARWSAGLCIFRVYFSIRHSLSAMRGN